LTISTAVTRKAATRADQLDAAQLEALAEPLRSNE
jgi:hypothetical protein